MLGNLCAWDTLEAATLSEKLFPVRRLNRLLLIPRKYLLLEGCPLFGGAFIGCFTAVSIALHSQRVAAWNLVYSIECNGQYKNI